MHSNKNSERFKVDWGSNHFYIPLFFIVGGVTLFVGRLLPIGGRVWHMHWAIPTLCVVAGIALYFVQRSKLKFKTLGTPDDLESFKAEVREMMTADGWVIMNGDDNLFIQAVYHARGLVVSTLDMVTLVFVGRTVLYNVVNHPEANRSGIAAVFSRCRRGKRLISRIEERIRGQGKTGTERVTEHGQN